MSAAAVRILNPLRSAAPKLRLSPTTATSTFLRSNTYTAARPAVRTSWRAFSQSSLLQEKKYTDQHEWIELSEDGTTATIGITTYAAKALGDVVYVELPEIDTEVEAGETIGAVESVKSASDILSPVSGTVVEANSVLEEKPKVINQGPEAEGWFAKVQVKDATELEGLMDEKTYLDTLEDSDA
ncbi:glycine cleavage system H protein [Polytolypa hystricis UAMH7299]|uniref:Glycine cleavage system H protein n=1 Tax=Polytolypa hystricis (strain UAMH7299) TaxID=1447883 RepID=A0A2B7XS16_POLH7|nr:glycine cleavage system H protein [Polytolypa hystricis UAMH7299]